MIYAISPLLLDGRFLVCMMNGTNKVSVWVWNHSGLSLCKFAGVNQRQSIESVQIASEDQGEIAQTYAYETGNESENIRMSS